MPRGGSVAYNFLLIIKALRELIMADVEIYIESPKIEEVTSWLEEILDEVSLGAEDDETLLVEGNYLGKKLPVIVQKVVEDGPFVGIWFNSESTPWNSDCECAREAFDYFGKTVQCDPGEKYPLPNQFFQISKSGEEIVQIDLHEFT